MAQRSLPQAGTGVGDAGPYTSDQWAELFQTLFTGDQEALQGPLRLFLNELEVTEAALAVTTDTGAGFVYGHFLTNDAAVVINIALAAAGVSRWDRVVMVENNTNAAYNTNLALPAAYAAGVPRNSARIAILQGVEGAPGIPRVLLTGPNYYMVELARYQVTDAAVGGVVDYREFCEFSNGLIDTIHLANDSVDDTKAGNRVPQFYRRKGGSATDWEDPGIIDYTPTAVRMQAGATDWAGSATSGAANVTYPVAFSDYPLVQVTVQYTVSSSRDITLAVHTTAAGLIIYWRSSTATTETAVHFNWLATGPE